MARSVRKSNHPLYQGRRTLPVTVRDGYVTLCWCRAPEHAAELVIGDVGDGGELLSEGMPALCRPVPTGAPLCTDRSMPMTATVAGAFRLTVDGPRLRELEIDANLAFGSSTRMARISSRS